MRAKRFAIIGAGIVGLATALRLQNREPDAEILVVEKEAGPAAHQSGHNSGVIHAGVYYEPGSLKARLCRAGLQQTVAFCREHNVPHKVCGKLVVAIDEKEIERLKQLHLRATENGVKCHWIDATELAQLEPNIRGLAALHVVETGIVDYAAVCQKMSELLHANGATVAYREEVLAIGEGPGSITLETGARSVAVDHLIACAGLQSDRVAALAGIDVDFAVVPFRGDFYQLRAERARIVERLIYPVADPSLPFLGVHLTATVDGGMTVGPSAMLAFDREAYRKHAFSWRDARDMARNPAVWRLLARYSAAGFHECLHAVSRRAYLRAVQRYCPQLCLDDFQSYRCGVRAQAVSADGRLIHDFLIKRTPRSIHICNAPSPAATAALPIASSILENLSL